ncbi:MAG: hypothetical protein LLF76_03680 [Planctomycetaceae bacterium]|nr:hypothetical protein [Planctomycetaceae bacterium]
MQIILKYIARLSLFLLTVPSFLFLAGRMDLQMVKLLMLIATILWFACTLPTIRQD